MAQRPRCRDLLTPSQHGQRDEEQEDPAQQEEDGGHAGQRSVGPDGGSPSGTATAAARRSVGAMDNRTEQIADGVWRVEVRMYCNAYVIARDGAGSDGGLILVDTGRASDGPALVRSVRLAGLEPTAIREVLLTRVTPAHAGAAARLATSSAAPRIAAGGAELPLLRAGVPGVEAVPNAGDVSEATAEGAAAGIVEPIATPGPSCGHTAYLVPERGVLLAGDLLWNIWRVRRGRNRCSGPADGLARLAGLDADVIGVGHGPVLDRAAPRVRALLGRG